MRRSVYLSDSFFLPRLKAPIEAGDTLLLPLPHHVMINHVYELQRDALTPDAEAVSITLS